MTRDPLEQKVRDLEERIEGLETLLAGRMTGGRVLSLSTADPIAAAAVESDQQHPSPAWGRGER